jgi:hypothetical protein
LYDGTVEEESTSFLVKKEAKKLFLFWARARENARSPIE